MIAIYLDSSIQQVVSTPKSSVKKLSCLYQLQKESVEALGNLVKYFALNL